MAGRVFPVIIDGAKIHKDIHEKVDVAVIGSGAGGAAAAKELAEGGKSVVVLEEGGHFSGEDFKIPPLETFDKLYRTHGLTGSFGNALIPIPLGRCVGGTTLINSGTCYRPPSSVLENWEREYGIEGLTSEDTTRLFERVEKIIHVKPVPKKHLGAGGFLFQKGAQALGFDGAPIPRNARNCRGSGVCAFGCPRDAKQATSVSYLPRAVKAGARVYSRCRVDVILIERGRAYGLTGRFLNRDGRATGPVLRVLAKAVFVAAGAIHTPGLLRRSRVPDPSRMIGRNLRIHPATRVVALFDQKLDSWFGVPQSYHISRFVEEGIFIQGQFTPPGVEAAGLPFLGRRHKELMEQYDRMSSFGALISDQTRGRVISMGKGEPLIWYRMEKTDIRKLVRAISLTAQIYFAAGAREVFPGIRQKPVLRSMEEARELESLRPRASDIEMMAFHPMGTARMGRDPERSVTNSSGECHAVSGLFVCDASLFPTSTKLNPQVMIMTLATRVALRYLQNS